MLSRAQRGHSKAIAFERHSIELWKGGDGIIKNKAKKQSNNMFENNAVRAGVPWRDSAVRAQQHQQHQEQQQQRRWRQWPRPTAPRVSPWPGHRTAQRISSQPPAIRVICAAVLTARRLPWDR
ncbi:unnamed protein product [Lampetra planeri]